MTTRFFYWLTFALLVLGFVQRLYLIDASLAYPRHIDEPHCANPARAILESQSFLPAMLNYPTLPIYLAAAGMVAGYVQWAEAPSAKVHKKRPAEIARVAHPYYDKPQVMRVPRQLFAALSMLAVLLMIGAARHVRAGATSALAAGLLLMVAPDYMLSSWEYLNVDIVGTFFCAAIVYALVRYWDTDSPVGVALFLGGLVGLAAGSKYFNGIWLLPVFGYAMLRHRAMAWLHERAKQGDFLIYGGHSPSLPDGVRVAVKLGSNHFERRRCPPDPKLTIAVAE